MATCTTTGLLISMLQFEMMNSTVDKQGVLFGQVINKTVAKFTDGEEKQIDEQIWTGLILNPSATLKPEEIVQYSFLI
ncbi:hypothetical protein HDV06_000903 [Boothiomyces sp. JEL0866]|nr:hypothetical protein HDV06_000903 [Boothiomyces sp. JEL0866]